MCETAPINQLIILKLINEINSQQKVREQFLVCMIQFVMMTKIFSKLNLPTQPVPLLTCKLICSHL